MELTLAGGLTPFTLLFHLGIELLSPVIWQADTLLEGLFHG